MMMNYETFKEKVKNELLGYLGEDFENAQVVYKDVFKTNQTLEHLSIIGIPGHENATPSISIKAFYEEYVKEGSFDETMLQLADTVKKGIDAISSTPIKNGSLDMANVEKQIFFTLVNTEQNRELLKNVPHREFLDLSIVYRWNILGDNEGSYNTLVHNEFAQKLGKSEEELFELAKENTKDMFPTNIQNIKEMIVEIALSELLSKPAEADAETIEALKLLMNEEEKPMFIISNKARIYGASSMIYEEKLFELSNDLKSDLYIMPSSVHEVIAVPACVTSSPENLADMVYEINMGEVDIADRLSNQIYLYDRNKREIKLATNTEYKSLEVVAS